MQGIIRHTHHNTVIHAHCYYTLQRGKRVYSTEPSVTDDAWFEFEADLYPPLMLLPATWKRYGYTVEDVHNTYEKVDASYMWQIALVLLCGIYEPDAVSAGIRSTFQSMFTFLFISRKNVFDAFLDSQSDNISKKSGSVLCHERPDHRPLLPKVVVSDAQFRECRSMVPHEPPSFRRMTTYDHLVAFDDVWMVPVEYDDVHNFVYMVRVLPKTVYDSIPTLPKPCVVTLPRLVRVNGQVFVLTEEACFFATNQPGAAFDASAVKKRKHPAKKSAPSIKRRKP